ncbi:MAG: Uma2 family endonuclease [Actinomycetota bacterium]|nr:Uma2 family endonuclease [Actinomycetota bacterium]
MATAARMTVDEYYATSVEGDRTQLVNGELVVTDPKPIHVELRMRIAFALRTWVEAAPGRGQVFLPTDVAIDEYNVFGPDVLWFSEEHKQTDLHRYPDRVPDLCVEIRSPGTWRYDIGAKKDAYERGGLRELWLVDDAGGCVLVFRRSRGDTPGFDVALELAAGEHLTSPLLPGFTLSVAQLFET